MMTKITKDSFYEVLNGSMRVLILPHIFPDGDTLGSSLALFLALKKLGKEPVILLSDNIPYNLSFLPIEHIRRELENNFQPDMVIAVDCSDLDRLGDRRQYIDQFSVTANIDHHITNTLFGEMNIVNHEAAATGEIIYHMIQDMNIDMDKEMATCLYAAISTDTGSFKYSNTTPVTHRIAAELLSSGIVLNDITTEIYQNKPSYQIKLLSEALRTLEFYHSGRLAIMHVSQDMIRKTEANPSDTDGLIEYVRDIAGVEVGILIKEISSSEVKVGFRSKYHVDVSEIAKEFGGGGHAKASGCTIHDNIKSVQEKLINTFKNIL